MQIRFVVVAVVVSCLAPAVFAGNLSVSLEPRAIVVDGMTPSGEVVVFSIAREQVQLGAAISRGRKFLLRDDTGSGRVRFDAGRLLEPHLVCVVVDLTSGRYAVAQRGMHEGARALPRRTVRQRADRGALEIALPAAEVLIVRPGDGAWFTAVGDGGAADDDGRADGVTSIAPRSIKHAKPRESRRVEDVRRGDLLVVIDPLTLRSFISTEAGQ